MPRSTSKAFELYVVSAEDFLPQEGAAVEQLLQAGAARFHLRKKRSRYSELKDFLSAFTALNLEKVVIHSHFSLRRYFKLGGVHLPERVRLRYLRLCRYLKSRGRSTIIISSSFHGSAALANDNSNLSYAFLSPIFSSISKGHLTPLNRIDVETAVSHSRFPLVALGGLDKGTVRQARAFGFDGAALHGSLWARGDALEQFKSIRDSL